MHNDFIIKMLLFVSIVFNLLLLTAAYHYYKTKEIWKGQVETLYGERKSDIRYEPRIRRFIRTGIPGRSAKDYRELSRLYKRTLSGESSRRYVAWGISFAQNLTAKLLENYNYARKKVFYKQSRSEKRSFSQFLQKAYSDG